MITASQLYDFVLCPHRVFLDEHGDVARRDEPNAFIQMLWEQGVEHEADVIAHLGAAVDLSGVPLEEREQATRAAIRNEAPLIYRGRLSSGDRLGEPDLLERRNGHYIPGDIKSGSALEGDEAKVKKTYAFQLAHYAGILADEGLGDGLETFVLDRSGDRVPYILTEAQGVRNTQTWWEAYQDALADVRALVEGTAPSSPALGAACKLCVWGRACKADVIASDDLTRIAELGRSKRDVLRPAFPTVRALAAADPEGYVRGKKTDFPGIGPDSLRKFHARAVLLSTPDARPYLKAPVSLPIAEKEVFFDIEADPFRDTYVYLHGMVERRHGQPATAEFKPFFAVGEDPEHEEEVFRQAWNYLNERVTDSVIWYYSKYERTAYKVLARRHPGVCSVAQVEELFALPAMVDLYDIVRNATEWPTSDQSIKSLAVYLGFRWHDTNPSGAASIEWYRRWVESGDPGIRQRILQYNSDDCAATAVVLDGIRAL